MTGLPDSADLWVPSLDAPFHVFSLTTHDGTFLMPKVYSCGQIQHAKLLVMLLRATWVDRAVVIKPSVAAE